MLQTLLEVLLVQCLFTACLHYERKISHFDTLDFLISASASTPALLIETPWDAKEETETTMLMNIANGPKRYPNQHLSAFLGLGWVNWKENVCSCRQPAADICVFLTSET